MIKPYDRRSLCGWSESRMAGGTLLIENMSDIGHGPVQEIALYSPMGLIVMFARIVGNPGQLNMFNVPHSKPCPVCDAIRPEIRDGKIEL